MQVNIKADIEPVINDLKTLGINTKYITADMLRTAMRKALSQVKKGYSLKKNTGRLYKSYTYKVNRQKGTAILFSTRNRIATAQERGSVIVPRKSKYLCFRLPSGQWVKTKSVKLTSAPYFTNAVNSYLAGGMQTDLQVVIDKAIMRFNAK